MFQPRSHGWITCRVLRVLSAMAQLAANSSRMTLRSQGPIRVLDFRGPDDDQSPVAISTSFAMVFMLRAVPAFPAGMRRRESAIPLP